MPQRVWALNLLPLLGRLNTFDSQARNVEALVQITQEHVAKSAQSSKVAQGHVLGIDSLRALAVLAVVIYHVNSRWLPGGFVGVDIFFVISGFVITKSLLERPAKSVTSFFTGFYRRRFIRIAPALYLYLAFAILASSYFISRGFQSQGIFDTARWAIFGASNIQLSNSTDGYFGDRIEYNPFIHTWSLGVEEQFYLIFPVVIAFVAFGIHRKKRALQIFGKAFLIALTVISFALCIHQTAAMPNTAFFMLPARFWELAVGALLYLFATRTAIPTPSRIHKALFVLGIALVVPSILLANTQQFPFFWAVPPVIGALALIYSANVFAESKGIVQRFCTTRPLVFIGKISYSLYLWHWGIIVLFRWTIGILDLWTQALALLLTFVAGWLSYRLVENPIRTSRILKRWPDVVIILLAAAIGFGVAFVNNYGYQGFVATAKNVSNPAFKDTSTIVPALRSIPQQNYGKDHRMVFVGDSHAGHYKYLAQWVAGKTGSRFKIIRNYGCGFVNLAKPPAEDCPPDSEIIRQILEKSKPGDIVILSSFSTPRIAELWGPLDKDALLAELQSSEAQKERDIALRDSVGIVKQLQAKGLHVVLAAPTPVFESPVDRCIRWFQRKNPACVEGFTTDKAYQVALREPVMKSYRTLATRTGALLWDPFPILCPKRDACHARYDLKYGHGYYFIDQHHLSANGNLPLVDGFLEITEKFWK